jgi:DNA-binding NtrC family response regulator
MSHAKHPSARPHQATTSAAQDVLVLSTDPLAAALIAALIETMEYAVHFAAPRESVEEAFRRTRPRVVCIDCVDPTACSDETVGRAAMRGISVVIFGTTETLGRVRGLALGHDVDTLRVPPDVETLGRTLQRAAQR